VKVLSLRVKVSSFNTAIRQNRGQVELLLILKVDFLQPYPHIHSDNLLIQRTKEYWQLTNCPLSLFNSKAKSAAYWCK